MKKQLQTFVNAEFCQVRAMEIENEPWFVGKDIANNLGYQNGSRDINRHVDEEDRQKQTLPFFLAMMNMNGLDLMKGMNA